MKCEICGKNNLDNAKFCSSCGSTLESDVAFIEIDNFKDSKEKFAGASMALGITSLIFSTVLCCFGYYSSIIAIICGALAIIFAIIAWNSGTKNQIVSGLVCGIIGLLLGFLVISSIEIFSEEIIRFFEENLPDDYKDFYE